MTIFQDAGNWMNNTSFGGWSLKKPTQYTFSVKNPCWNNNASLTFGFDTNLRSKFKFSLRFRF